MGNFDNIVASVAANFDIVLFDFYKSLRIYLEVTKCVNQEWQILKSAHKLGSKIFAETCLLCYSQIPIGKSYNS